MSSLGLAELTAQAKDLVGAGDLGSAQMLLSDALAAVDVDPLRASADLADAAGLLARVLVALGEPHSARAWATFAHTAQRRLRGPADERTVVAAATLAAVLHRVGAYAGAAHLYRDVVARLTLVDGPGSMRVLAAQADLATVEHARGECVTARRLLADAYRRHRETYGEGHPAGIKMLARLGTMERDCGNFGEAHRLFSGARDLCRDYLPADHPMAAQIAALARAGADPDHTCRNLSPADDDFSADPLPGPPLPIPDDPATPTVPAPASARPAPDDASGPHTAAAPGDASAAPFDTTPPTATGSVPAETAFPTGAAAAVPRETSFPAATAAVPHENSVPADASAPAAAVPDDTTPQTATGPVPHEASFPTVTAAGPHETPFPAATAAGPGPHETPSPAAGPHETSSPAAGPHETTAAAIGGDGPPAATDPALPAAAGGFPRASPLTGDPHPAGYTGIRDVPGTAGAEATTGTAWTDLHLADGPESGAGAVADTRAAYQRDIGDRHDLGLPDEATDHAHPGGDDRFHAADAARDLAGDAGEASAASAVTAPDTNDTDADPDTSTTTGTGTGTGTPWGTAPQRAPKSSPWAFEPMRRPPTTVEADEPATPPPPAATSNQRPEAAPATTIHHPEEAETGAPDPAARPWADPAPEYPASPVPPDFDDLTPNVDDPGTDRAPHLPAADPATREDAEGHEATGAEAFPGTPPAARTGTDAAPAPDAGPDPAALGAAAASTAVPDTGPDPMPPGAGTAPAPDADPGPVASGASRIPAQAGAPDLDAPAPTSPTGPAHSPGTRAVAHERRPDAGDPPSAPHTEGDAAPPGIATTPPTPAPDDPHGGEPGEAHRVPWAGFDEGRHTPLLDLDVRPEPADEPVVGPWHPPLQDGGNVEPWRAVSFYAGHELRNPAVPEPRAAGDAGIPPWPEPDASAPRRPGADPFDVAGGAPSWPEGPDDAGARPQSPAAPYRPESWRPPADYSPSESWQPTAEESAAVPWEPAPRRPADRRTPPWHTGPSTSDATGSWRPPAASGPSEPWPRGADGTAEDDGPPAPAPRWPASGIPRSTPWVSTAAAHPVDVPLPREDRDAPEDWPLDQPPPWQPPEAPGAWSSAPPPVAPEQPGPVPPQSRPGRYATPPLPYGDTDGAPPPHGDAQGAPPPYGDAEGAAVPLPPAVIDDLAERGQPPAVPPHHHPVPADPETGAPPGERGYEQRQTRQEQPWRTRARGVRTPPPGGRYSPLAPGYGQPGQPQIKAHRRTQGDRSLTAGPAPAPQRSGMLVPARRPAGVAPERYPERPIGKILAALIVVGLGTVVVIGGFLLTERDTQQPPPTPPSPTGTPAGPPTGSAPAPPAEAPARAAGGPPTGLRIDDARTRVTLTWSYPENAEGPVLLNGGRKGQPPQLITELPAGTETFAMNLNNPDADYCFTVAVVYSTTSIQKSPDTCTTR